MFDSFSLAQKSRHYARTAAAMEYGKDNQRLFVWRINNHKIPHRVKTQGPQSQLGTAVAYLRKCDQGENRFMDFLKNPVGRARVVNGDEFPNFV
jgi:hypothetical protein